MENPDGDHRVVQPFIRASRRRDILSKLALRAATTQPATKFG